MSWVAQDGGIELGDARRTRRLIKLVEDLSTRPTGSIPLTSGDWAETKVAYRLLDTEALDWRELLEVHTERTRERLQDQPVVLCLQDTTELDFTSQPGMAGLGRLSYAAQHGLRKVPVGWKATRSWPTWPNGHRRPVLSTWRIGKAICGR